MNKQTKLITAFAAATAAFALSANASSIGINMGADAGGLGSPEEAIQNVLPSGTSAGVVPQTNWNNKTASNHAATTVTDDTGFMLATTVQINTSWTNGNVAHDLADGDRIMMNSGIDNGGGPQGATIEGITFALYDVYVYYDGGSDDMRGGSYQVWDSDNSDAVLAAQSGYDSATFDGTYIQATGDGTDGMGGSTDTNYVKLTGLTASNIKIRSIADQLGGGDVTKRAPINGFQIVEVVPEPSTTALLGLGGLALIFRRRK